MANHALFNCFHLRKIFFLCLGAYIKILLFYAIYWIHCWLHRKKLKLWEILGRPVSFECLKGTCKKLFSRGIMIGEAVMALHGELVQIRYKIDMVCSGSGKTLHEVAKRQQGPHPWKRSRSDRSFSNLIYLKMFLPLAGSLE